jgi:hypothetical protein
LSGTAAAASTVAADTMEVSADESSTSIDLDQALPWQALAESTRFDENQPILDGVLMQNPSVVASNHSFAGNRILQSLSDMVAPPTAAAAPPAVSASCSVSSKPILIPRSSVPVCEFTENDALMLGAFSDLFMLGRKIPCAGSLPPAFVKYLMSFHDQRFSQNQQFLLLCMNQAQRHSNLRTVISKVRSENAECLKFQDMLNDPGFPAQLKAAIADPEGKETKKLVDKITPVLKVGGSNTAFSPAARAAAVSKLHAMVHTLGLPAWYVTVAPDDSRSQIVFRFATSPPGKNGVQTGAVEVATQVDRLQLLAKNPVAAAK